MNRPLCALTSLSPADHQVDAQRRAIGSWRDAGLEVRSINHPDEIRALAPRFDVEFVPADRTTVHIFGRHCVPVTALLESAARYGGPVLLVNSDIELRMAPWEVQRVQWLAQDGVACFVRHNHDGDLKQAVREPFGFDAFLFSGSDAALFPDSFLSVGQPWWDYWIPHVFGAAHRPVLTVDFPAAFHRAHPRAWSWEAWHRCALEFARVTNALGPDSGLEACLAMSDRVRAAIGRASRSLPQCPVPIRTWVETTFRDRGPKTFLEIGAHCGTDTEWLARIPGVTLHAFEPDPRNHPPALPNVTLHRAAVSDDDGRAPFILSKSGWGQVWTHSSSLRRPKNHLHHYPVTFGPTIDVDTVALDSFARTAGIERVDFVWADVQGAEGDMVRGGLELLRRTRYLYTEYSNDELYEGQVTLADILALLPSFRVVELWPTDVLLENRS